MDSLRSLEADRMKNTASNIYSSSAFVCCLAMTMELYLLRSRCLATAVFLDHLLYLLRLMSQYYIGYCSTAEVRLKYRMFRKLDMRPLSVM
jgi:hypothetical protein